MKNCPFCAEEIQDEALKCRYCNEWLPNNANLVNTEKEEIGQTLDEKNEDILIAPKLKKA